MIILNNISKSYGPVKAVSQVSLEIGTGSLFGLIGPDGAGKTTLFRIITTLLLPDTGSVSVFGYDTVRDYRAIRQFTGYMPGRFSLYPDLTVRENLDFYATLFNTSIKENYNIIRPVYSFLEPFSDRLSRNLSGGMKQKLALCCALIHNPKLLVLDEPTTGVDAVSRKEFWETLHEMKNTGMTIVVSTPYMDEAARCDRVALIQHGTIVDENSPEALLSAYSRPLFEIHLPKRTELTSVLRKIKGIRRAYLFGQTVHIATDNSSFNETWLGSQLVSAGIGDFRINRIHPDFEDCFIEAVEDAKNLHAE